MESLTAARYPTKARHFVGNLICPLLREWKSDMIPFLIPLGRPYLKGLPRSFAFMGIPHRQACTGFGDFSTASRTDFCAKG